MLRVHKNKEVRNASWLIAARIAQMLISLVVGLLTARFLGPSNFGLINYGAAYVAFFTALSSLGINSVIVKNFVDHPQEQGETIGSALALRAVASFISMLSIIAISLVMDAGEYTTILVVALCALSLVSHIFETFNFWFQNRYHSKKVAIATLAAYMLTAIYKIVLLILGKNVLWFAFATALDYLIYALIIYYLYRRDNGPSLSFSFSKSKQLIRVSYHYILSGLMVSIYGYTGNIMLKQMLDEASVGYYATAVSICMMWTFVLQAIIDSVYPTIMRQFRENREAYERKNRQLYAIVFYVSMSVSLFLTLFGSFIVTLLYGEAFAPATLPLQIATWYTAFAYLGVARNAWIICENQQKYLKYIYFGAAIMNVALNFILIPWLGVCGAAVSALVTQIGTSLILPCMFSGMRRNTHLILEAVCLKGVFPRPANSN